MYPPGVTGNEPQITGEWPCDECFGKGGEPGDDKYEFITCTKCEGKGYTTGDEAYWNEVEE